MNKLNAATLGVALTLSSFGIANAQRYFNSFDGQSAPSKGKQFLVPEKYKIFSADNGGLQAYLHALKSEPNGSQTIELPTPDGSVRTFKVWKSSMMEEPLQTKYSNIETFTAVALDNSQVTAKLDFTVQGFHAMVFDGNQTFLVDPYTDANDGYYLSYYKNDYKKPVNQVMTCGVTAGDPTDANGNLAEHLTGELPKLGAKTSWGTTQKTYRLALSCTGEYAQAVGGSTPTKATVLSAMVTSMNRVNGIYQREVGVTMELIGNNDTLIYLNPNNDPFSANNNGGQLLGQNAQNTGTIIGAANYDIGHIFSTGGGGIASLGCVCRSQNNLKAQGVTGSPDPVGDAYDVDYVAHEMGHQFGASHTFNSDMGSCNGNRADEDAFETGSGTTIMAYAGICFNSNTVNDNIQEHSDAYFHAVSLDEISDFLSSSQGGAACGVAANGVSAPVLPSIADTFNIPAKTPFELTGPLAATDSTDTLTYCWEEWDLGNYGGRESISSVATAGPVYRSFYPKIDKVRVVPQIDWVLSNSLSGVGERMPSVDRSLNFKLTARSIYNGFGTFNITTSTLHINVLTAGGPFVITSPNLATDAFTAQGQTTVTWNVVNTTQAPISTPNVDIFMSIDGGYTFPYTLATGVPNNGSATVTIPNVNTTKGRIKVKGAGNIFFDISNYNFKVTGAGTAINDPKLNSGLSVYPNPASDLINIKNKGNNTLNLNLFNVLGQKMWSGSMKETGTVPVGGLSRGIYYLQLIDANNGAKVVKPITLQ